MDDSEIRTYVVNLTKELIRTKTVNYSSKDYPDGIDGMTDPGEEWKVAEIVKREFKDMGVEWKEFNEGKRPDVLGFIGQGLEGYPRLFIAAHMDTIPAGEGWETDPFDPVEKDGYIFGRGALDDKGPLAAILAAAKLLKDKEIKGQVIIGGVSDEEVGMCPGMAKMIEEKWIEPTHALIPDTGGDFKEIIIGEKRVLWVDVTCKGKTAHGSTPYHGESAILAMTDFISLLKEQGLPFEKDPIFEDDYTINYGMIRGGTAPNQVAGECQLTLDMRLLPSQKVDEVLAYLEQLAKKANDKVQWTFSIRAEHVPIRIPDEDPLVKTIVELTNAKLKGIGGGTVSKILVKNGINSIGCGPGSPEELKYYHAANERISIQSMVDFAKNITRICEKFCNMPLNDS